MRDDFKHLVVENFIKEYLCGRTPNPCVRCNAYIKWHVLLAKANALGCGVVDSGSAVYGMGTYHCITPVFATQQHAQTMIERGLNTEHHAIPDRYVSFIYNQGGSLVKWYRDTFAAEEHRLAEAQGQAIYPTLFDEIPAEPGGVMILPHFTATGPPEFISDSSGLIAGLAVAVFAILLLSPRMDWALPLYVAFALAVAWLCTTWRANLLVKTSLGLIVASGPVGALTVLAGHSARIIAIAQFLIAGGVLVIAGLANLAKFVAKNPVVQEDLADD